MALNKRFGSQATSGGGGASGQYHKKDSGEFKKTLKTVFGFLGRLRGKKKKRRFTTAKQGVTGVRG